MKSTERPFKSTPRDEVLAFVFGYGEFLISQLCIQVMIDTWGTARRTSEDLQPTAVAQIPPPN